MNRGDVNMNNFSIEDLKDELTEFALDEGYLFIDDKTLTGYAESWYKTPSVTGPMIIQNIIEEEPQHLKSVE
jgi:hypothetical protein